MSISDIVIKIVGIVLAILGLTLIASAVGVAVPMLAAATLGGPIVKAVIGVVLIGFGIFVIRGGTPTL